MAKKVLDPKEAASAEARVRKVLARIPSVEERITWDHPTFRMGGNVFAALHESGLILRCSEEESRVYLADSRFSPAPYWGRLGWVCVDLRKVPQAELKTLLTDTASRVRMKDAKP